MANIASNPVVSNVPTVVEAASVERTLAVTFTSSKTEKGNVLLKSWPLEKVEEFFRRHGHPQGDKDVAVHTLDGYRISAYSFCSLRKGGKLIDADVEWMSAVVLDFDNKDPSTHAALPLAEQVRPDLIAGLLPCWALIHTSYSHTAARSCFRVMVPLSRDVPPTEYLTIWKHLVELTGGKADPTCKNPSRIYFMPRRPVGSSETDHMIKVVDGPLFDVDALVPMAAPHLAPSEGTAQQRKPGMHLAAPNMHSLARKLEISRQEPIIAAMLAGQVRLGRDAWRFIADAIAVLCEAYGDEGLETGKALFHEASATDDRVQHGYDRSACEAQWADSVRRARAAVTDIDAHARLFVTYAKLKEHGVPHELCSRGVELAKAPAAWVNAKYAAETGEEDSPDKPTLETFLLSLNTNAIGAADAAMKNDELLLAIGRQQENDGVEHERLSHALKGGRVSQASINSLFKAAKAKWIEHRVRTVAARAAARAGKGLPRVVINDRQLNEVRADTEAALIAANTPPTLFVRGKAIVRIEEGELLDHSLASLRNYVSRAARFIEERQTEKDTYTESKYVPKDIVEDLLAVPPAGLPRLQRVVTIPLFSKTGILLSAPGYHRSEEIFVSLPAVLQGIVVSSIPTNDEVQKAKALFFDDLWVDFPLTAPADRAHLLACALLPFVRQMIDGPTPLHVFEVTKSGTGKSLLGDVIAIIVQGKAVSWRTLPTREEEREKTIFTVLRSGSTFVGLDNAKARIDSQTLEGVLTSEAWSARVMGSQVDQSVPNKAVWMLTANNAELTRDLGRRAIRIRQDAKVERPELRNSFKHPDLKAWTIAHRADLVQAALTIIQNWIAKGRPAAVGARLSSFETWSTVMGGILQAAEVEGFLDTGASMAVEDEDSVEGRAFVEAWYAAFDTKPVSAKMLYETLCHEVSESQRSDGTYFSRTSIKQLGSVLASGSEAGHVMRVGKWVTRNRDGRFGNLTVRVVGPDSHDKMMRFKLDCKADAHGSGGVSIPAGTPRTPATTPEFSGV
jgi:hypothetical protein